MARPRTLVALAAFTFVACAFALDRAHLPEGSLAAALMHAEIAHLVAHSVLYGGLAALIARWRFPADSLDAGRVALARRALGAALVFLAVAAAQEGVQALSRGRPPCREELFDLGVDVVGATLGLIAWSRADRRRIYPVARAIGVVLHPAFVGPVGVFAVTWAAGRDLRAALAWTALATLAAFPVAAVWAMGLRRGWFRDADLSVRRERPPFLAVACVAALGLALIVHAFDAPAAVRDLCLAGALATGLVTAVTLAGLKVSGHVAVPVGAFALLLRDSPRAVWPFAVAAVALSWARVREGRHTPREVAGAWGLAGASAAFVRIV
jgi:hypothetical protein